MFRKLRIFVLVPWARSQDAEQGWPPPPHSGWATAWDPCHHHCSQVGLACAVGLGYVKGYRVHGKAGAAQGGSGVIQGHSVVMAMVTWSNQMLCLVMPGIWSVDDDIFIMIVPLTLLLRGSYDYKLLMIDINV